MYSTFNGRPCLALEVETYAALPGNKNQDPGTTNEQPRIKNRATKSAAGVERLTPSNMWAETFNTNTLLDQDLLQRSDNGP
jgi:hypothetical protein